MIVNFVIFFLVLVSGGPESPFHRYLFMNTDLVFKKGQIWRLFTYMYAHAPMSLGHVGLNMLALYFLGIHLERGWGTRKFVIYYHGAGIIALTFFVIFSFAGLFSQNAELVGASGCVFAVLTCCAVLYPKIQLILFLFHCSHSPSRRCLFCILDVRPAFRQQRRAGEAWPLGWRRVRYSLRIPRL